MTVLAVLRGAAVLVLVTWIATRWLGASGRTAAIATAVLVAAALLARVRIGAWRRSVVPDARDLPMLAVATLLTTAWIAPVTRHGVGAIGTGNHADMPSYLMQATYLWRHGVQATGLLPGVLPDERMFDGFGAYALLAPTTLSAAAPAIGVLALMGLGAAVLAQVVERMTAAALPGTRVTPALVATILLASWPFTFNAFAYFVAQVWGLALGLALVLLVVERAAGPAAALDAALLSVAGVLVYNPTGAMYAVVAVLLGAWLLALRRARRRPLRGTPELALLAGVVLGGLVFAQVWRLALDRLDVLRDAVAGFPMPTAPLWAALGIPFSPAGNANGTMIVAGLAIAAAAGAGWALDPRGRRALLRFWPLLLPVALWIQRAWELPTSYQQWKAFAYAQPVLLIGIACGIILLAQRLATRLPAIPAARGAIAGGLAAGLLACAAGYGFWPRAYFADGGCCIASSAQIDALADAARAGPGPVRISGGNVWVNDLAGAIVSRERPVAIEQPTIWTSQPIDPVDATIGFETGTHPSLVQGRFVYAPVSSPPP